MSSLFDEVEKQARALTPQEKASLARILIEELDPTTDAGVEQVWIEEARRRGLESGMKLGRVALIVGLCGRERAGVNPPSQPARLSDLPDFSHLESLFEKD